MAGGADLDVELGFRRTPLEGVPARAGHLCEHVLRMDSGFHWAARIPEAVCGATLPPETTRATVEPGSSATLPDRTAAAGAAPATSHASFVRRYMNRKASSRSSSVTSTDSTPSAVHAS